MLALCGGQPFRVRSMPRATIHHPASQQHAAIARAPAAICLTNPPHGPGVARTKSDYGSQRADTAQKLGGMGPARARDRHPRLARRVPDRGLVAGARKERKPVAMAFRRPVLAPRDDLSDARTCPPPTSTLSPPPQPAPCHQPPGPRYGQWPRQASTSRVSGVAIRPRHLACTDAPSRHTARTSPQRQWVSSGVRGSRQAGRTAMEYLEKTSADAILDRGRGCWRWRRLLQPASHTTIQVSAQTGGGSAKGICAKNEQHKQQCRQVNAIRKQSGCSTVASKGLVASGGGARQ